VVIFSENLKIPKEIIINDSKKMTPLQREKSAVWIKKNALFYDINFEEADVVDVIKGGITGAEMKALHGSLDKCYKMFDEILMDGDCFYPYTNPEGIKMKHTCLTKGDARCKSIAAASILAKTARDNWILDLIKEYPELETRYGLSGNKGK
jgi:ribonuclease HII